MNKATQYNEFVMSRFDDARQTLINFINHDRSLPGAYRPFDAMKEDLVYNLIDEEPNMAKLVLRLYASDVEYCTIRNNFYDDIRDEENAMADFILDGVDTKPSMKHFI